MADINDSNLKNNAVDINSYLEVQIKEEIVDDFMDVKNEEGASDTTSPEEIDNLETFKCSVCHKPHANLDDYTDHMKNYHTNHYECEYCDATFNLRTSLNQHKKMHNSTTDMLNICDICGAIYEKLYALKIHMRTHTEERPFPCDVCQRRFRVKDSLRKHVSRSHMNNKNKECDVCHERFDKKVQLMSHKRKHTGKKPFECYVCHKTYEEKGSYNTHMFTHKGVRSFKCDICQKSFVFSVQLRIHSRIHTGEKPFECDICHKRFTHKGSLSYHANVHSDDSVNKPHECTICKKRFYSKSKLRGHMMKIHRSDRDFECGGCFRRYDSSEKLVRHIKRTCSKQ